MTARRWITVLGGVLLVSLALNLFLGGIIAGRGLSQRGGFDWQMTPAKLKLGLERVSRSLPSADAELLEASFESQRADITQRFQALQEARRTVGAALRAEPYDPTAFAAAYEAMQARSQGLQAAIHGVIKESVAQFSVEGRTAVAERRWRR
ncbi:MAG: periplasmic heavy metal sensor [Dongiaceae bacterium]